MDTRQPATPARTELGEDTVVELAQVFKLLGDTTRLRIVSHVNRHGKCNVTELCEFTGLSQPLVSHHLGLLRGAGVLEMCREGKCHYYAVNRTRFAQLMGALAVDHSSHPPCDRFLACMFG